MSIALDANGNPHALFDSAEDIYYGKSNDGGVNWSTSSVQTATSLGYWQMSIAIDGADNPHLAYKEDFPTDSLKYARYDGSSWHIDYADNNSNTGRNPSIALNGSGIPRISYYYLTGQDHYFAKYSTATDSFDLELIDNSSGQIAFNALALDANDNPHVAYYDGNTANIKYAYHDGASWVPTTIDYGVGTGIGDYSSRYCSIALDGEGYPHITYRDQPNKDLKYAAYDGVKWSTATIDSEGDVGYWSSIAIDGAGTVHIAYTSPSGIKAAHWSGTLAAPMGGNARSKVQAPTGFDATSVYESSITWTWSDNSTNELGFRLYGAEFSTGPFALIAGTVTIFSSPYYEIGLTPGTSYFRYIAAVNDGGVVTSSGAPNVSNSGIKV
ncbi:hypothetical protein ACFLR5_02065 [Elusimicrobiota bacterium]